MTKNKKILATFIFGGVGLIVGLIVSKLLFGQYKIWMISIGLVSALIYMLLKNKKNNS